MDVAPRIISVPPLPIREDLGPRKLPEREDLMSCCPTANEYKVRGGVRAVQDRAAGNARPLEDAAHCGDQDVWAKS